MAVTAKSAPHAARKDANTAERIVAAATHLFASRGYEAVSVKEICDAAEVNIAAIHYHFGSKDELLRFIIESFGDSRLNSVQRILEKPETVEEFKLRLKMFLCESLQVFVKSPDLCRIVQQEIELVHARSRAVFRRTFLKLFDTLISFMAHARKRGIIAQDVDPTIAARALFSQLSHQTRTDRVNEDFHGVSLRDEAYRKKWVEQVLRIFLRGTLATRDDE